MFASKCSPHRRRQREGVVLILTLLILVVLVVVIGEFRHTSLLDERVQNLRQRQIEGLYTLRSGVSLLQGVLQKDGEDTDIDTLQESWAKEETWRDLQVNGASLKVELWDGERFLNINFLAKKDWHRLMSERLLRLCQALGLSEKVAKAITDFIDEDTKGEYEQGAKNGPLESLEELRNISTLSKDDLEGTDTKPGILAFLTVHSSGKVNINTAPKEVLMSLSDKITSEVADQILSRRESSPFQKVKDLATVSGLENLFPPPPQNGNTSPPPKDAPPPLEETLSVSSAYFHFRLETQKGNSLFRRYGVLWRREKNQVTLLFWRPE